VPAHEPGKEDANDTVQQVIEQRNKSFGKQREKGYLQKIRGDGDCAGGFDSAWSNVIHGRDAFCGVSFKVLRSAALVNGNSLIQ
jgi:hypothetical protein